ncbi:MAG: type II toxin-antitoxin system VapC family toxin [Solirubrobacteraceae bacterium]
MTLFYLDSSALVKLVRAEPATDALRAFLANADLLSSELALTEVPRAIHRVAALDRSLAPEPLLTRTGEVLDAVALLPVDRSLLAAAGALEEPMLRALDAIHLVTAIDLLPIDAFVSYDERQSAAARLAGLRTVQPGV